MNLAVKAQGLLVAGEAAMVVRVVDVKGSAPREEGAAMLVTARGTYGSIGGGTLEWKGAAEAQRLLVSPSPQEGGGKTERTFMLGPDLGQCCGGQVRLMFSPLTSETIRIMDDAVRRRVYLFGAGHVGRALVLVLAQSELEVVWIDDRPGAFPSAVPGNVTLLSTDDLEVVFKSVPQGSLAFIMTHSHALDLAIVNAALRQTNIVETGLIGSATKRARFESRLKAAGVLPEKIRTLICPIGVGGIRSKKPEAIAIATAAQILALDEKHVIQVAEPLAVAS